MTHLSSLVLWGAPGWGELLIILLIVLLVFGAKRLPEVGRSLGEAVRGFKKGLEGDEKDNLKPDKSGEVNHDTNKGNERNEGNKDEEREEN